MKKVKLLFCLSLALLLFSSLLFPSLSHLSSVGAESKIQRGTFTNGRFGGTSDPFVTEHNGKYYYCYAGGGGVNVKEMSSTTDLNKNGKCVWTPSTTSPARKEIWAPELHYIDGSWYIYVAADDGKNENHRMYVLRRDNEDPVGRFTYMGKITDSTNKWAIDGTVMHFGGELYFIWSGWKGDVDGEQDIFIAHMSDPMTIDSARVCISVPYHSWEKVGNPTVNEGPAVLYHNDDIFLVYSASGSWTDDYCLGMMKLVPNDSGVVDPLDWHCWDKGDTPVFKKKDGVAYGPGHCSFVVAPDGVTLMYYHANLVSGTGWNGRSAWIQPIQWKDNGDPDFGEPQPQVNVALYVIPETTETTSEPTTTEKAPEPTTTEKAPEPTTTEKTPEPPTTTKPTPTTPPTTTPPSTEPPATSSPDFSSSVTDEATDSESSQAPVQSDSTGSEPIGSEPIASEPSSGETVPDTAGSAPQETTPSASEPVDTSTIGLPKEEPGLSTGAKLAIAAGSVVGVGGLGTGLFFLIKRFRVR